MKLFCLWLCLGFALSGADSIRIFGRTWTVPSLQDWKVEEDTLHLVTGRDPLPGPRRPHQFAVAQTADLDKVTVEGDVKPGGRSLMIVFAYRDKAHFDYAHISTDTGIEQPHHNGIFHVYGGERVRISNPAGPAAFAQTGRWYHVKLTYSAKTGQVRVLVDGRPVPALNAVDVSLGAGKVGIGSFDETGSFKNVRILEN